MPTIEPFKAVEKAIEKSGIKLRSRSYEAPKSFRKFGSMASKTYRYTKGVVASGLTVPLGLSPFKIPEKFLAEPGKPKLIQN